jgi:hypothetical protein
MARKINISEMSHEEVIAYAEKCKQQNQDRVNRYYQNTVIRLIIILKKS